LRKHISLVLQEPWIFNGTIKDNIVYNNKNITNAQLEEICDKINILHFIRTLPKGFDAEIDDNTDLSFGEKQLITIARQLASDSKFVIFDEATSNVDIQTEIKIQKAIETLTKEKTTITIAHRLSTIINSDLIIVMKNGKIVEKGSHKELLKKKGTYSSLYNSQFA
jgi:ATP-binding cassette subfamily B protein